MNINGIAKIQEQSDDYQALIQFLYRAPIGLVQISNTGFVEMINPNALNLLMPLSQTGALDNLFSMLSTLAPQLYKLTTDFLPRSGVILEALRINCGARAAGRADQYLSISLLRIDTLRLMAVIADATLDVARENYELIRRLDSAAHTDALTGLPNRLAMWELLQRIFNEGQQYGKKNLSVFSINCNRFRQINDTFGRAAGDLVLKTLAERLRFILRENHLSGSDVHRYEMVTRLSGDEFGLVLTEVRGSNKLCSIAHRLQEALAAPYFVMGEEITCTVRVGIVAGDNAVSDADGVLQDGSIALAEAKRLGGAHCLTFDPAMRMRAVQCGTLEIELRRAIRQNELFVVYQPIVGLHADGSIDRCSGVEALVRWQHPIKGILPPIEFIGVAEECGLICALGDFVLDTACEAFMGWQRTLGSRAPKSIAINLSRAQLTEPGLVEKVSRTIASTKMQASQLTLEITESIAAQGEVVLERLHKLKTIGIKLALDDFGTGYSSLACLHLFPVDIIKIDRSFVSAADTSEHHRILIKATVLVARNLGISTVAEGIETPAQVSIVKSLGCNKAQGYLYSRPLSEIGLEKWLSE